MKRQINIRVDAVTAQQIEQLTAMDNSTQTMVIARAVERYHQERTDKMTDRTEQVDWMRQLAANLAELHRGESISAEEIVEWYLALGDNGAPPEMPGWFDDHDHKLLLEMLRHTQQ